MGWPGRIGALPQLMRAWPGLTYLLLALHPTHVDVAGVGGPGQLLGTQGAGEGRGSVTDPGTLLGRPESTVLLSAVSGLPSGSANSCPLPSRLRPFLTRWYRISVDVGGSSSTRYRLSLEKRCS